MTKKNPNPIDVHVGSRVRMRRMLINMSQEKLGEKLGLTFQQVQKYEKGSNRISASRLFQISQILGVPVQFFFEDLPPQAVSEGGAAGEKAAGFGESGEQTVIMDFLSSSDGLQLNRYFAGIRDPKVRRGIIDLVKTLARAEAE